MRLPTAPEGHYWTATPSRIELIREKPEQLIVKMSLRPDGLGLWTIQIPTGTRVGAFKDPEDALSAMVIHATDSRYIHRAPRDGEYYIVCPESTVVYRRLCHNDRAYTWQVDSGNIWYIPTGYRQLPQYICTPNGVPLTEELI
jgi:hypothetical protein